MPILVITFLKPHASHLSLLRVAKPNAILLNAPPPLSRRRRFSRTTASAVNTSLVQQNSSTIASDEPQKVSVLTFQHAIQRLQEYWAWVGCAVMQCSRTDARTGLWIH
ncbi:PREDICTED: glycine--tRNA ligase, chloroplastic/mitochondrial 2 [Theobroma cacao]|uniref:Glycine--tRNA ligase, chloroplastic/mitochondrial 2 n=1 Tax=Theobroma cacao TaxID=3641 RepID=A0AB32W386_THECC|nr:PREDICTED: glycine--tRNA ligase, chloroplastic/mitochondrial 2 [Theobroma cacao]